MSTDLIKPTGSALPLLRQTLSGSTMGTRYSCVFYVRQGMNFEALAAGTLGTLERRLNDSISSVASFIVGAWEAAGKPAIPKEASRTPRPIRRPNP
mgnify:CR=1 FL=1